MNAEPAPEPLPAGQGIVTINIKPTVTGGLVLAEPLDLRLGLGLAPTVDQHSRSR